MLTTPGLQGNDDGLRLYALRGSHIDFYQDIPPVPRSRDAVIRATLLDLSHADELLPTLRFHRYAGTGEDRDAAAGWIAGRLGKRPDLNRVILTHGTQSALTMLLSGLLESGGVLLTEALTYPSVKPLAHVLGLSLRGIAIDGEGLRPDAFDAACRDRGRKVLYCMPSVHNPTTATMSEARRRMIVEVARRHGVVILEDDTYGPFSEHNLPPLAAIAPEICWHICSLAKSFAVQLRVTLVVAPSGDDALRYFGPTLRMTHWMAAPLSAHVAALWMRNGRGQQLFDEVRGEASARQAIANALLNGVARQTRPHSLHFWLALPQSRPRQEFVAAARDAGVLVGASDAFAVPPGAAPEGVRICLGSPPNRELVRRGLSTLAQFLAENPRSAAPPPDVGAGRTAMSQMSVS